MSEPVKQLNVGDRIKIGSISPRGRWWTVRAVDTEGNRYAVATCPAPFKPKGEVLYTIIDLERKICGPCNLIGGGYDINEPQGPWNLLHEIKTGELEISRRNVARYAGVTVATS